MQRVMFVPTRSSVSKNRSEDSLVTVTFKGRQNERSVPSTISDKMLHSKPAKKEENISDLKKLRYEVIKFGSSGLDGSKKEESRVALAVALGAVPPKGKRKNYKKILAEKNAKKEERSGVLKQTITMRARQKGTSKWKKVVGNKIGELLKSYGKVKPNK